MTVPLPQAALTVQENALGAIATPPEDVVVVIGPSSKGNSGTDPNVPANYISTPVQYADMANFSEARGCGPGPKAALYLFGNTQKTYIFIRVPKTARDPEIGDIDISGLTNADVAPAATGTPLDSYEIVVLFTLGGTTGMAGIKYRYSLDGGSSYSAEITMGVELTLDDLAAETGVTITMVTGKAIVTDDSLYLATKLGSESITAVVAEQDVSSTSVITATGTPEDFYEVLLQIIDGGTIGEAGITYRYSLDGGRTFTRKLRLGTDLEIDLLEYAKDGSTESTGVTIEFAAGDLTAGDSAAFRTTGPEASDADITAAMAALKGSNLGWSWILGVGQSNAATAGDVHQQLQTMLGEAVPSWAALSARDRGYYERDATWEAELLADVDDLAASRIAMGAGYRRITCPWTGRKNRRPAMWVVAPRLVNRPMQEDPARTATGPLPPDVEIANDEGLYEELDARLAPALHGARYVTLRTYEELEGLYVTLGSTMAAEGTDITLIPLRRVLDLGTFIFRRSLARQLVNQVFVNPDTFPVVERRGCIREVDALTIERECRVALEAELVQTGRASAVRVVCSRTDKLLTNGGKIRVDAYITPLGYLREFQSTIGFINPAISALQAA